MGENYHYPIKTQVWRHFRFRVIQNKAFPLFVYNENCMVANKGIIDVIGLICLTWYSPVHKWVSDDGMSPSVELIVRFTSRTGRVTLVPKPLFAHLLWSIIRLIIFWEELTDVGNCFLGMIYRLPSAEQITWIFIYVLGWNCMPDKEEPS